jgi:hypothetical protein
VREGRSEVSEVFEIPKILDMQEDFIEGSSIFLLDLKGKGEIASGYKFLANPEMAIECFYGEAFYIVEGDIPSRGFSVSFAL